MARRYDRKLILEDGSEYLGYAFGAKEDKIAEIVFNTSMVGYQEIVSDPSYTDQAVVMTYPLIGNYGIADEDFEGRGLSISALIVGEYNDSPSNFRYTKTLSEIMEENGAAGIEGLDTRRLTRSIRDLGSRRVLITSPGTTREEGLARIAAAAVPHDAVARVSCRKRWYSRTPDHRYNVVVVDCGTKLNIIRSLNARGCNVTVVPYNATAEEVVAMRPDGVFFSNGPGDPEDVLPTIGLVRALRGRIPIFGICLGHQLISLSYGARTYKLKFGHRGGNHPVMNLGTGHVEITSQNHSYAVDEASLSGLPLRVTHRNLLDGTVEGVACPEERVYAVQYHPESAPGPQDSFYLFDLFIREMKEAKEHAEKN